MEHVCLFNTAGVNAGVNEHSEERVHSAKWVIISSYVVRRLRDFHCHCDFNGIFRPVTAKKQTRPAEADSQRA